MDAGWLRAQWEGNNWLANECVVCCRGQYSDAVLSSLESQNDSEVEGISAKVKMLKDVLLPPSLPFSPSVTPKWFPADSSR